MDVGVLLSANEYCMKIQMKTFQPDGSPCQGGGWERPESSRGGLLNSFLKKA
jgi:hypothetical protein